MPDSFHTWTRTSDVEVAEAALRAAYQSVDLGSTARLDGLHYAEEIFGEERFTLSRHLFDGRIVCTADIPFVTVVAGDGEYLWQLGDERGDLAAQPALFQPGETLTAAIEHSRTRVINLQLDALRSTAGALFGEPDAEIRFESATPVSEALGSRWLAVMRLADRQATAGAFDNDLLRASLYRQLAVATIETFALTGDHAARRTTVASRARAFKRAVAYIDGHASLPITLDDVALAAGTTAAELDRAFDMHLPYTAEQYLRSVRLAAAHRDLQDADPASPDAVGAIAARWGFPSRRAFERQYRARYGVAARRTLLS
ncbi:MAG TPA: helix-turn-helix domain-containing protein [Leifsonia sp.]